MEKDFSKIAESYLSAEQASKISRSSDRLEQLANSPEGQRVKQMMDNSNLNKAIESGNADELKSALAGILSTKEGKSLAKKLNDIMNG